MFVVPRAACAAAVLGGAMMGETPAKALTGYSTVGWFCAGVTLLTAFMVGLLRTVPRGDAAVVELPAAEPLPKAPAAETIRPADTSIVLPQPPLASPEAIRASAD
jgi:hypothetical protein